VVKFLLIAVVLFCVVSLLLGRSPARILGRWIGRFMGGMREGIDTTNPPRPRDDIVDVTPKAKEKDRT
jgi:Sec-independent protein translocase protein TatA